MTADRTDRIARILGIGFDQEDGHVRVTRGESFDLYMGSDASHKAMQELCLKVVRRLKEQGRELQDLTRDEFVALLEGLE